MDQGKFDSVQRKPTLQSAHGGATQKSIGQVRVDSQMLSPPRGSGQSTTSSEPYPPRSGLSDLVRGLLSGHDPSTSPRPRRNQEQELTTARKNDASLLPDLEKTLHALQAERELTKKLFVEKAALEADNSKLVKLNSGLAKENTTFRKQLQLESEDDLIKQFRELHNRIQTWCQKFFDSTSRSPSTAEFPKLPFASNRISYAVVNPDKHRVPYNIAVVWEYLLDYVFEDHESTAPDLWTTRQNAKALEHLDHELRGLNLKDTTQWRSLTVRLLSEAAASKHDIVLQSISKILNTVLEDITKSSIQIMGKPQAAQLQDLERELEILVEIAIGYSCVLRRQRSWVCLVMPHHEMTSVEAVQSDRDFPSTQSNGRGIKTARAMAQTCIFTRPQLVRFTTVTGENLAEQYATIQEPEELRVLVFLDKSPRAGDPSERRHVTS